MPNRQKYHEILMACSQCGKEFRTHRGYKIIESDPAQYIQKDPSSCKKRQKAKAWIYFSNWNKAAHFYYFFHYASRDFSRVSEFCEEQNIEYIDFLLIDAEGYDLFVLKGIDWDKTKPEIITCEFEDRKTKNLGYTFQDMANFLQDKGYKVLVSEWHPILRYGISHDWRRLAKYPCEIASPDAWGNLIAFRNSPDWQSLLAIAARHAVPVSNRKNLVARGIKAVWERLNRRFLKVWW